MQQAVTFDHPPRGTCAPGCELWLLCHCGCGTPTKMHTDQSRTDRSLVRGRPYTWLRGHNHRAEIPNVRFTYSVPVQRVLPLVEFLFDVYRTHTGVGAVVGVDEQTVRKWRHQRVRRVSPGCARKVVAAVKAEEQRLRAEAVEPESRERRHRRHAARGEKDVACDWCWRDGVPA